MCGNWFDFPVPVLHHYQEKRWKPGAILSDDFFVGISIGGLCEHVRVRMQTTVSLLMAATVV